MRKLFFILIVFLILSAGWIFWRTYTVYRSFTNEKSLQPPPSPTEPTSDTKTKSVSFGTNTYAYDFISVSTPSAISVIPNFSEKKESRSLMEGNSCTDAINGGFYTKSDSPLGLFRINNHDIGPEIESRLVDGFFWADDQGRIAISSQLPEQSVRFAIQIGPMLISKGDTILLSINKDTHARRMIVAQTTDGLIIFASVYNAESVFDGPKLSDVPAILERISKKENLTISEAINLDGGSASAYYHGDTSLSELTFIGSLFCIKQ